MPNPYFRFKQFAVYHDRCAMKVTTDGCLFGAWVADQLKNEADKKALDIGAGTGLLSLMVAQQSDVCIDAVELEPKAAAQATENITASPWQHRIRLHQGNILAFGGGPYDFIFSNPPFYESEIPSEKKSRNMAHHGKSLRLEDLLIKAGSLLAEAGSLFLLLPYKRFKEVRLLLFKNGWHMVQEVIVHPSFYHPPFRIMLHVSRQPASSTSTEVLYIKDPGDQYSAAFTQLLRDYYLHL